MRWFWIIGAAATVGLLMATKAGATPLSVLKSGVKLGDIQPQMVLADNAISDIFRSYGLTSTITSADDGTHMEGSLHYVGLALDYRTHDVPRASLDALVSDVRAALGAEYDVILESKGLANEHMHVEYDPK